MSFCQFWSDDFQIVIRHSWNGPKQCPTSKFRLANALDIDMSKIVKGRAGATLMSPETMKEFEFLDKSFFTWFSRPP